MRRRATADALVAALTVSTLVGCLHRRGDWHHGKPRPAHATDTDEGVTLVLLGNAGWAGRGAKVVARELERVLEAADDNGRPPMVLWLGNNVMAPRRENLQLACPALEDAWTRPGVERLHAVVGAHLARGYESYAVPGEHDWRCDVAALEEGVPWRMPAAHYVVRVTRDGKGRVVSACDAAPCVLEAGDPEAASSVLLELVMIDPTAWVHRDTMDPELAGRNVEALESLLEAIESGGHAGPPRVLVTHYPVEAAGWHGQGGGRPDSSWPYLPPALQRSLAQGTFAGVLAAHDHGVYADEDLSNAVKRADRVWLEAPLFQVVSGGASTRTTGLHRMRHFGSVTLLPDLYSPGLGFATVHVDPERIAVVLHSRRFWRWETARISLPLRRTPHPAETETPPMSPCLRCPEVPPNERP